jgi:hemoglobin-like flavoprotein
MERPEFVRPYLQGLGALHVAYGVTAEHYPAFGECLLDALRQVAGDTWTEPEERAWRGAVVVISEAMLLGASRVA